MNTLFKKIVIAALAATAVAAAKSAPAKKKAVPVEPPPPRSVFVMPSSPRDGRDPFFPDSTRPYQNSVTAKHKVEEAVLVIKGLSIENGRAMLIINNHTFAVGDEGDVLTSTGRAHVRLLEIRQNTAVVEVNGSRRELSIVTQ